MGFCDRQECEDEQEEMRNLIRRMAAELNDVEYDSDPPKRVLEMLAEAKRLTTVDGDGKHGT